MNFSDWEYLYNWDGKEWHRANLVYTPYISPDKKIMCMSFHRDKNYHTSIDENNLWTEELLSERFNRELYFHSLAKNNDIPTLNIIDVNESRRQLYIEWFQNDFYTQGQMFNGYDNVLPNWKSQWISCIKKMWDAGILKFSLHPNSWVAIEDKLIPFNWFFSFERNEKPITIGSLLIQISMGRQEKLQEILKLYNMNLESAYPLTDLQVLCFNSFRSNYSSDLIDTILDLQRTRTWE